MSIACVAAVWCLLAPPSSLHAETLRHVPTVFHQTVSASTPPALRVKSGDTVTTSTLDDLGAGADGKTVAKGPNPLTGPFHVAGAEPGDLLVITLTKLTPNRASGTSTSYAGSHALAPGAIDTKPDDTRFPWTIDKTRGVVRFDLAAVFPAVPWKTRFSRTTFELPLRPSLGFIGLAPADGAEDGSADVGPTGGNLISGTLAAGTKVMLPVMQPGAMLMLGHGHARQGDGQFAGTGVETSLDVEFSVELIKKKEWPHSSVVRPSTVVGEFAQGWPRLETAESIMTIGSGPSLQQAVQRATLELHRWLDDDFGFSEKSVSIFLGQALEYELTSVSGPRFVVTARVRKAYLPPPTPAE